VKKDIHETRAKKIHLDKRATAMGAIMPPIAAINGANAVRSLAMLSILAGDLFFLRKEFDDLLG
jgi:hypothetical protein